VEPLRRRNDQAIEYARSFEPHRVVGTWLTAYERAMDLPGTIRRVLEDQALFCTFSASS
jgi:hypothetical protein